MRLTDFFANGLIEHSSRKKIMWHGSDSDDPRFDIGHRGKNSHTFGNYESNRYGIFFTDNPQFAALYGTPKKFVVYPKNTFDFDYSHDIKLAEMDFLNYYEETGVPDDIKHIARYTKHEWEWFENELGAYFVNWLKDRGYDSARFTEYNLDDEGKELVSNTLVILDKHIIRHDYGSQLDIHDKIYEQTQITELNKPPEIDDFKNYYQQEKEQFSTARGPDKYPGKNPVWERIRKTFSDKGFDQLGHGVFATVFSHPSYPLILKVFRQDDGYMKWLNFVNANQGNIHLPQLRGKVTNIKGTEFYFIRMEKLKSARDTLNVKDKNKLVFALEDLGFIDNKQLVNRLAQITSVKINYDNISVINDFLSFIPDNMIQDVSIDNFMMRGNTPVILDPLASRDQFM